MNFAGKKRTWTERYSVLKESGSGGGGVLSSRGFVGVNNAVLYKIRFLQRCKAPFVEEDGSNVTKDTTTNAQLLAAIIS
jgi:hypothetical protein